MKLAVSSIAWSTDEEPKVVSLMNSARVKTVELAPTKIWAHPTKVSARDVAEVTRWWSERGISIYAFQSMLFSRPDLKLFESEALRAECLQYLKEFITLAGRMGVKRMVFGSPKNRQRGEMSYDQAFALAIPFFKELAEVAYANKVVFCIEPNAPLYGCDFVTTASEGADLVRAVDHPGFGLHLDTACMMLAGDDPYESIHDSAEYLRHFHVSAPMLGQVDASEEMATAHASAATALREIAYDQVISIEMRPYESGNVQRVETALNFTKRAYGV